MTRSPDPMPKNGIKNLEISRWCRRGGKRPNSQISTTGKQLVGKSVHDLSDRRVGEVVFADVDQTGTTNAIVVQLLDGSGKLSHRVRVPISAISLDGDKLKTTTDLTKAPRDG